MSIWQAPSINSEYVCIASTNADKNLVAVILSCISKHGEFSPLFKLNMPDYAKNLNSFHEDDDYFTNIIFSKTVTQILNSIAKIACKKIILIGLNENQLTYLEIQKYYKVSFIQIDKLSEVNEYFADLCGHKNGMIKCSQNQIFLGLQEAISCNKVLEISLEKEDSFITHEATRKGIIVAEKNENLVDLIVTNYAISINADIKFIDFVSREEAQTCNELLIKWKRNDSYGSYLKLESSVKNKLQDISLMNYEYVTFFTAGIPYGIFFNLQICSSHVFKSNAEDLFIFNNIYYNEPKNQFGSAVIFSPEPDNLGAIVANEVEQIEKLIQQNNYNCKTLRKKNASTRAFDEYVSHYPYDLLHITSHGGKTTGYCVLHVFEDRCNDLHELEYEEVVGFQREDSDMYTVVSKKIFKTFDGLVWKSKELKDRNYPQYIYDDMGISIYSDRSNAIEERVKVDYLIENSAHILCFDSIHQGQFHSISAGHSPVIFNNSCNSYSEFSAHLINAGCRGYIGTLWNVGNQIAFEFAKNFYVDCFNIPIIKLVNKLVNEIEDEMYKDVYIFCGLHFANLSRCVEKDSFNILKELTLSLDRWCKYVSNYKEQYLIMNGIKAIKFICKELFEYRYENGVMMLISNAIKHVERIEYKHLRKCD